MSAMDDLNNAVTALTTGFTALDQAVQAELTALTAALSAGNSAAIEQAATNIGAITGKMAVDAANLTASIPAATTVPPPSPPPTSPAPTVAVPVIATPTVTAPNASPPSTPPASAITTSVKA